MVAESLEQLVRRAERRAHPRLVGPLAALLLLTLLGLEAWRALALERGRGVTRETPFGTVHFRKQEAFDEVELLRTKLRAAGAKEMFAYPSGSHLYLLTDTSNPTRFQELIPGLYTDRQFAEAEELLERKRVPFVVRTFWFWGPTADPLYPYLARHYEKVRFRFSAGRLPTFAVFQRKSD